MGIQLSHETEVRLTAEARRMGVSVEALLERLIGEKAAAGVAAGKLTPGVPVLHLGVTGSLHRRDIYDDAD